MIKSRSLPALDFLRHKFAFKAISVVAACLLLATVPDSVAQSAVLQACDASQLSKSISAARPGDTVVMCNRTWNDTEIRFDVDGNDGAPISLVAESPGNVVLTGSSRLLVSGNYAVVDGLQFSGRYTGTEDAIVEFRSVSGRNCDDCRVTNLSVISYNPSVNSQVLRWVVLHGKRNRIDHSHFKGKNGLGAMIQLRRGADQSPNNHSIDHNLLEDRPDFTAEGNQNGDTLEVGETGKFSHGDSQSTVEFNYLRNIDSDFEAITVKSSGNLVQYNVLESSRGVISLRTGSGNVVHGNFILGHGKDKTGGIRIRGKDHIVSSNYISDVNPGANGALAGLVISGGTDEILDLGGVGALPYLKFERADNVSILNNTIVNSGLSVSFGSSEPNPPTNIFVSDNIIVQPAGDAVADLSMGPNINFSNNLFFGASLGINTPGVFMENPLLAPDVAGIQRPTGQSPAIDAVWSGPDTGWDMDGQARKIPYDIGADEVVAGEAPRGMIPLCGVGPRTYRTGLPAACDHDTFVTVPRPRPPSRVRVSGN